MIQYLLAEEVIELINNPILKRGLYLSFENGKTLGIDNSTHEVWIEEFNNVDDAVKWLRNDKEIKEQSRYKVKMEHQVSTQTFTLEKAIELAKYMNQITKINMEILEVI